MAFCLLMRHNIMERYRLQGLHYVAEMTGLEKLTLIGCDQIGDAALERLSALTNLQELHVQRCRKVSKNGVQFSQHLPKLHSLTMLGRFEVRSGSFLRQHIILQLHDSKSGKEPIVCL